MLLDRLPARLAGSIAGIPGHLAFGLERGSTGGRFRFHGSHTRSLPGSALSRLDGLGTALGGSAFGVAGVSRNSGSPPGFLLLRESSLC
jgi:hypothetical protein